mmetsp:Transcript_8143/g.20400  ORF Transcript_8143/g.20400 Transcript_8143/m.20400 type:complete len:240 (+) Transcript_8143:132-851(+)
MRACWYVQKGSISDRRSHRRSFGLLAALLHKQKKLHHLIKLVLLHGAAWVLHEHEVQYQLHVLAAPDVTLHEHPQCLQIQGALFAFRRLVDEHSTGLPQLMILLLLLLFDHPLCGPLKHVAVRGNTRSDAKHEDHGRDNQGPQRQRSQSFARRCAVQEARLDTREILFWICRCRRQRNLLFQRRAAWGVREPQDGHLQERECGVRHRRRGARALTSQQREDETKSGGQLHSCDWRWAKG